MARKYQPKSLAEMLAHPWAALKAIQGLDPLPDRRVSLSRRNRPHPWGQVDPTDPIRSSDRASQYFKATGVYAFEDTRLELYAQFHEMDFDAIIAQVLDAFATEATQTDYERRAVVWVESENKEVQKILTRTLNRLKIQQQAFPYCRALAKDGDVMAHIHGAPGQGVLALKPYKPYQVARIEDRIGRLIGFSPADEQGNPTQVEQRSILAHQGAHFRLPPKELGDPYGAESSFLWGARVIWRQLQLMFDQVVLQRLLRRPDRLLILMDTSGMSMEDSYMVCKDFERRLHRETYTNPGTGESVSAGSPIDIAKDVVLPLGKNNNTQFTNLPATNQNDIMRDVDMAMSMLAAGIGFPLGFVGRGEQGGYNPGQTLSRQYQPFAKKASRLQGAFLHELTRVLMIDLAWNNLSPYNPANAFTLHMANVAPIIEMERNEVLQLRLDRMERGVRFGIESQLNLDVWIPYVLEFWGGLPRELVGDLYKPGQAGGGDGGGDQFEAAGLPGKEDITAALLEALGDPQSEDLSNHVRSDELDPMHVMPEAYLAKDGKPSALMESTKEGSPKGEPLVEVDESRKVEFDGPDGTKFKGVLPDPNANKPMDEAGRRRAVYRISVMGGIAERVLADD